MDGENCYFKIDTDSDISLVNRKLINSSKCLLPLGNCCLKYPTGEEVSIQFKVLAQVVVGKFSLEFPLFVTEISDDCILGVDFLRKINLTKIFESEFGGEAFKKNEKKVSSRLTLNREFPEILQELFQLNSNELDNSQKKILRNF